MNMENQLNPVVEVEEEVYCYEPAHNGAGPMWCRGNTCIARLGEQVFASGLETIPGAKPLNNCVPLLFRRTAAGWEQIYRGEDRTREPSPLACIGDRVLLSVNPTLVPPDSDILYGSPAQPQVLEFSAADPHKGPKVLLPCWQGEPAFTEHSYRSFVADRANGEMILFQNIDHTHAEWAFCDCQGEWLAQGQLAWPWGAEYDEPQPIRVCYPVVQLKSRAAYFCGVSDIAEPYKAWREHKKALTGQRWDYDFRRLFFTWSDDIASGQFYPWLELSSRDKTAGGTLPCDMWVGPDDKVHILWTERALDERLREKFFPLEKQTFSLNYAVVHNGGVLLRRALQIGEEFAGSEIPGEGRFQISPDGRLFVFYHVRGKYPLSQNRRVGTLPDGTTFTWLEDACSGDSQNRLVEILPDGTVSEPVAVPLQQPLHSFFTATERGGSSPSNILDLFGDTDHTLRYARVRID